MKLKPIVNKLLILDFFALYHRARNAMKRTGREFSTSDGIPTTGVFSFMNCLLSTISALEPTHVVCCYDAGGNARKKEDEEYKANRAPRDDDFMTEAKILLDEGLHSMGIECVGVYGYEADDIIATLARQAEDERETETIIFTCDQDLLQLVNNRTKVLLFNSAKKVVLMGVEEVMAKWNCYPEEIALVKAISGDASDNIKGVKGVGMKTAVKILHDAQMLLEVALEHKKLKDHKFQVLHNLDLVTLRHVAEIGTADWSDYELGKGDAGDYRAFLQKYEFNQLLKRADKTDGLLRLHS